MCYDGIVRSVLRERLWSQVKNCPTFANYINKHQTAS